MNRRAIALLATTALLSACADEATRREFLYKPAYCLAGGLAQMGSEACLPQPLKEKAEAVATAKQSAATAAPTPAEDTSVYYTDDQRMVMSYAIARAFFAPSEKLTKTSATMSLEASNLIEPAPASKTCNAHKARTDAINYVRGLVTDTAVNRDTAQFLSENYTDAQLTELYRVAKAEGSFAEVKDAPFIMPDPKRPGQSINVKPKGGSALGSMLSYTTSRVASRAVEQHRAHIAAILKERTAFHRAEAARTNTACADETAKAAPAEPVKPEAAQTAPADTKE